MFKKLLIANRGEVAVRVIRACRELSIPVIALFQEADTGSLHVKLSDECVRLDEPGGFMDPESILRIAVEKEVQAVHPGYGYLAEQPEFIRACEDAGITFIGPPSAVVEAMRCKLEALVRARQAGFPCVEHSTASFDGSDADGLETEAERLGYPLVIKSCLGGRGPGERLVHNRDGLQRALDGARRESTRIYGSTELYLEKAVLPAVEISVQVLCDRRGERIHLGECQTLAQYGNRRLVAESPAPALSPSLRENIRQAALELAGLFDLQNAGTVEFLVDQNGRFFFTEIKPRLMLDHPLFEMVSRVDLVQAQIRLAAGENLPYRQADLHLEGHALLARVNAEDPWNSFLPSPGPIRQIRAPGGPQVRVDTHVYSGFNLTGDYDPLIAKLAVWGETRQACLQRMRRALEEFHIAGTTTNLSLLRNILSTPEFLRGSYTTEPLPLPGQGHRESGAHLRDIAAASAVLYLLREHCYQQPIPVQSGNHHWQRNLRTPPQWNYTGLAYEKDGSDR